MDEDGDGEGDDSARGFVIDVGATNTFSMSPSAAVDPACSLDHYHMLSPDSTNI